VYCLVSRIHRAKKGEVKGGIDSPVGKERCLHHRRANGVSRAALMHVKRGALVREKIAS